MIQCARLAFGFGGIYDQDEAERIVEAPAQRVVKDMGTVVQDTTELRAKWIVAAHDAQSPDGLAEVWQAGVKEIRASGDMQLYTDFKQAVVDRKASFEELSQ